jgi:hypothetical protein
MTLNISAKLLLLVRHISILKPDDGGSIFLRNVYIDLQVSKESENRRLISTFYRGENFKNNDLQ